MHFVFQSCLPGLTQTWYWFICTLHCICSQRSLWNCVYRVSRATITCNIISNHKSSLVLSPPVIRLSLHWLPFANVDLISYNRTDKQQCNASGNNRHPKAGALSRWICALLQSGVIHHHPSQIWLQETDYTLLNLYRDVILLSSAFFIGFWFESHCIYTAISCIVGLRFLKCVFGFCYIV